ncbi:hypothetical protein QBE54_08130 [Thermatribacter velox]|uniref:YbhB/YbcL family Raf kinase inhibitor-like protein n=1 Tax=Thermatribacter velox TaxID=3039681 RepID=A0ABZ2Y963_9BACT
MGPKPPFGTHRYCFRIFALGTMVRPDPKMTRKRLFKGMDQHVLAQAQLVGLYGKKEPARRRDSCREKKG